MNLLVTVGSLPYALDRLVTAVDHWAAEHPDWTVNQQVGYSTVMPRHAREAFPFCPFRHFQGLFDEADVVVSHGSAGPILGARRRGLPIVLVPRQERFGECYNDHQVETCEAIRGESTMREIVLEIDDLPGAIERAARKRQGRQSYESHRQKQQMVAVIRDFLAQG
ncbi:MAG: glycosyltransferase [Planctomycetota bacterium]